MYQCCDPDCRRYFESEFQPPTVLGDPLCPECVAAFDVLMKELAENGVTVSISHGTTIREVQGWRLLWAKQ